jgi:hypothetical protein
MLIVKNIQKSLNLLVAVASEFATDDGHRAPQ